MASTCKACGKPLVWIQTPKGKWIPCDEGLVPYKQDSDGTDVVVSQDGEAIRCRLKFEGLPTGMARVPHWATCTSPDRFRKRKEAQT